MSQPTSTPWEFTNYTKFDGSPILTAFDVAEITAQSALKSDTAELWGVSIPGPEGPVICYTGNGPTSQVNAAFIARAANSHDEMLRVLNEMCRIIAFASPETLEAAIKRCYDDARAAIDRAEGRL